MKTPGLYGRNRVMIVEDDRFIRESFAFIVDNAEQYIMVGSYGTAEEAVDCLRLKRPDIILMDIKLPGMDGIVATKSIKDVLPSAEVIIVSMFDSDSLIMSAFKAGATGYIEKTADSFQVLAALDKVRHRGSPMSLKAARTIVSSFHINTKTTLSRREAQVLTLTADGMSCTAVAEILFISPGTVKCHLQNIYKKLEAHSKASAIAQARRDKLI